GLGVRRVARECPGPHDNDDHDDRRGGDPHASTLAPPRAPRLPARHCVTTPRVPMMMRGCRDGSSQRSTSSSCPCGSETQPAVAPPVDTCRKIALPSPGVRAALYAITAP